MISLQVNGRDIARATKKLDTLQKRLSGKDKRLSLADIQKKALGLLVAPMRAGAARHRKTGKTMSRVRVKTLRKRPGEVGAVMVGSASPLYARAVIGGPYSAPPDNWVMAAVRANEGQVRSFIDENVKRLY